MKKIILFQIIIIVIFSVPVYSQNWNIENRIDSLMIICKIKMIEAAKEADSINDPFVQSRMTELEKIQIAYRQGLAYGFKEATLFLMRKKE